jgi:hypothetical protein
MQKEILKFKEDVKRLKYHKKILKEEVIILRNKTAHEEKKANTKI